MLNVYCVALYSERLARAASLFALPAQQPPAKAIEKGFAFTSKESVDHLTLAIVKLYV